MMACYNLLEYTCRFSIAAARVGKELCLAAKVEDTRMLIMPDNVDFFPSA